MVNFAHLGQRVRGWPLSLAKRPGAGSLPDSTSRGFTRATGNLRYDVLGWRPASLSQRTNDHGQDAGLCTPAGMEKYQEEISVLTMPQDVRTVDGHLRALRHRFRAITSAIPAEM